MGSSSSKDNNEEGEATDVTNTPPPLNQPLNRSASHTHHDDSASDVHWLSSLSTLLWTMSPFSSELDSDLESFMIDLCILQRDENIITDSERERLVACLLPDSVSEKASQTRLAALFHDDNIPLMRKVLSALKSIDLSTECELRMAKVLMLSSDYVTRDMLDLFNPFLDQYCIPKCAEAILHMHGIVCFNEIGRAGARNEAVTFSNSLRTVGVKLAPEVVNWSTQTLLTKLKTFCAQIRSTSSLVVVCVMIHGFKGIIYGCCRGLRSSAEGNEPAAYNIDSCQINQILYILEKELPETVPKLVIVQACQGGRHGDAVDSSQVDADIENISSAADVQVLGRGEDHVELRISNTTLLMATRYGELALRNHFLTELAESIRQADGQMDVYGMFLQASRRMERQGETSEHQDQNPEHRSTCRKRLVFPAVDLCSG